MHQESELFLCQLCCLLFGTGPFKVPVFEPAVQEEEPASHPQESFAPVSTPPAEKEQGPFFIRIQIIGRTDDLGQSLDPLPEVTVTTFSLYVENVVIPT